MKRLGFTFSIFLIVGLATHGQDNTISESDLYGCWTMERVTRENGPKKRTYTVCDSVDRKTIGKYRNIIFRAYNKCEFPAAIQDVVCPVIYQNVEGTWTYDEKSGIVEVFYPKDFKKEFWDAVKEEYPEMKIPNPRMKIKFRIVGLENGKLQIEKNTPNKVYN